VNAALAGRRQPNQIDGVSVMGMDLSVHDQMITKSKPDLFGDGSNKCLVIMCNYRHESVVTKHEQRLEIPRKACGFQDFGDSIRSYPTPIRVGDLNGMR